MNTTKSHYLNATEQKAKQIVLDITTDFQNQNPQYKIKLKFNKKEVTGEGHVTGLPTSKPYEKTPFDTNFVETIPLVLGTKHLTLHRTPTSNVPDAMLTKLIFTTQHELRHIHQALKTSKQTNKINQIISAQRLAVHNNPALYTLNSHNLLSEKDANEIACAATIKYMLKTFPNIDPKTMNAILEQGILLAHNHKNEINLTISNPPRTPDELQQAFKATTKHAMKQSIIFSRNYERTGDEVTCLLKTRNKGWHEIYDSIRYELDPAIAYEKLACLQCYLHPYMQRQYPNTFELDLSPESIFGQPMPGPRMEVLSKASNMFLSPQEIKEKYAQPIQIFFKRPTRNTADLDAAYSEIKSTQEAQQDNQYE